MAFAIRRPDRALSSWRAPVVFSHPLRSPWSRRAALVALALASACESRLAGRRDTATDDFGDTVAVAVVPQRIVSLNPTTTELLYTIGAGGRLVGRTTYDRIPPEVRSVPDLGPGL